MSVNDALVFIDTNKYSDLYWTNSGKKPLGPLGEQASYIYVTQQIVNEVQRNKIAIAIEHFQGIPKELTIPGFSVPEHMGDSRPVPSRVKRNRRNKSHCPFCCSTIPMTFSGSRRMKKCAKCRAGINTDIASKCCPKSSVWQLGSIAKCFTCGKVI